MAYPSAKTAHGVCWANAGPAPAKARTAAAAIKILSWVMGCAINCNMAGWSPNRLSSPQACRAGIADRVRRCRSTRRALDIGQSEKEFVAGTAADIDQRRAQSLRRLVRIHAEGQRRIVRRCAALLRARGRKRWRRNRHHQDRRRPAKSLFSCRFPDALLSILAAVAARPAFRPASIRRPAPGTGCWPPAVSTAAPAPACSRAVNSVCWVCSTVRRLTVPPRNCVSDTSKALREAVTASACSRSCRVNLRQGHQRLLDIGEGRQHRLAVGLQVLQLHALGLLQLALQQEAVEQRLGQSRGQGVEPGAGPEQRGQRRALHAGLRRSTGSAERTPRAPTSTLKLEEASCASAWRMSGRW